MFKTLLLAVDVNAPDGAERSLQAALSMVRADGAMLHVLNVVPDTGMAIVGASLTKAQMQETLDNAKAELHRWAAAHVPSDIPHKMHIVEGTVYDQILRAANALEADAIVVGAHRPALRDYLMGPNAARVARHANQSVFVIR